MKQKVKWWISLGMCERHGEWEFDYDPSDEELRDRLEVEINNHIDSGWNRQ